MQSYTSGHLHNCLPTHVERKDREKGAGLKYYLHDSNVTTSVFANDKRLLPRPYLTGFRSGFWPVCTREQQNSYYATRIGMPPDTSLNFQRSKGSSPPKSRSEPNVCLYSLRRVPTARQLGNGGYPSPHTGVSSCTCDSKQTWLPQEIP